MRYDLFLAVQVPSIQSRRLKLIKFVSCSGDWLTNWSWHRSNRSGQGITGTPDRQPHLSRTASQKRCACVLRRPSSKMQFQWNWRDNVRRRWVWQKAQTGGRETAKPHQKTTTLPLESRQTRRPKNPTREPNSSFDCSHR